MCEVLVGLPDVRVLGVDGAEATPVIVYVELIDRPACVGCGARPTVKDRSDVVLVDLPVFGRRARLVWRKHRWACPNPACEVITWTGEHAQIASPRMALTDRAGRWATEQVGRAGRTVSEVADELGCDWHTVNDAVMAYGTALVEDPARIGEPTAVGLDETLFARQGTYRTQCWSTQIVDVTAGRLLDIVEGRDSKPVCEWFTKRPAGWCERVRWATLDLSNTYKVVFDTMLPSATQVADPFHVVRLANTALDECRRRVQNETLGHRGRKDDPLYRCRRLLTMAAERVNDRGRDRLRGLLDAGDPHGEVRYCWHAKEIVRQTYDHTDAALAQRWVDEIVVEFADETMPLEVRRLGRTIKKWRTEIVAWHHAHVSNGPTEAVNNLIKRVKRVAFGFRKFSHYRIRALLYAGRPNWGLLATITPR